MDDYEEDFSGTEHISTTDSSDNGFEEISNFFKKQKEERLKQEQNRFQNQANDSYSQNFRGNYRREQMKNQKQQEILTENSELKSEIEKLRKEIKEKDSKIAFLSQQNSNLQTSNQLIENTKKIQESRIQSLESKISLQEQSINELQRANEDYRNQIDSLRKEKSKYEEKNTELCDDLEAVSKELIKYHKKGEKAKMKIDVLKDELTRKEGEITKLQTTVTELRLSLNLAQEKTQQLMNQQQQNNETKSQQKDAKKTKDDEIDEVNEDVLKPMEDLLKSQSDEIQKFTQQRTLLINLHHKMSTVFDSYDKQLAQIQEENERLKMQMQTRENKLEEEKQSDAFMWKATVTKVQELMPPNVVIPVDFEHESKEDIFESFITHLLALIPKPKIGNSPTFDDENMEQLHQIHVATVRQLSSCVDLLKQCANSTQSNSDEIILQCNKIKIFLDSQNQDYLKQKCPSLFNQNGMVDIEEISEVFQKIVGEENMKKSPFVELQLLVTAILQVNKLIMQTAQERERLQNEKEETFYALKHKEAIKQYNSILEGHEFVVNTIKQFLGESEEEDTENVEQLFNEFISRIKDDVSATQKMTTETISTLTQEIDALKQQILNINQRHEQQKEDFCNKATKIVDYIVDEINKERSQYQKEIIDLKSQIKQNKKGMKKILDNHDKNFQKSENEISFQKSEIGDLTQHNEFLQKELDKSKKQLKELMQKSSENEGELKGTIEQLKRTLDSLNQSYNEERSKRKLYKAKYEDCLNTSNQHVNEMKSQYESLSTKYDQTIQQMQERIDNVTKENEKLHAEIENYAPFKKELEVKNAKLQVSERSAAFKLKNANEALERMKVEFEESKKTIIQNYKEKNKNNLAEAEKRIESANDYVKSLLLSEFGVKMKGTNTLEDSIAQCKEKYAQRNKKEEHSIYVDAVILRKHLEIDSNESLFNSFCDLLDQVKQLKSAISKSEREIKYQKDVINKLQSDKNELSDAVVENHEWARWVNLLYCQIEENNEQKVPIDEAKKVLENAVLSITKEKTLLRKLNTLRSEKQYLIKHFKFLVGRQIKKEKIHSTRPLMLAFIFIKRLEAWNESETSRKKFHSPKQLKSIFPLQ